MQTQTSVARAEFVPLGGDLRGYYAVPAGSGPFPAVVVFQEVFGVNDYIQSEVRRLAEHGYAAIAPDYFRGETFTYDQYESKVAAKLRGISENDYLADIDAAMAYLNAAREVKKAQYGVVGFCMGGYQAVLAALSRPQRFAAAVSFYGGGIAPVGEARRPPLIDRLDPITAELLLIYGVEDPSIPPAEHGRLAEKLSTLKKRYTLSVYAGAGHGFASRDRDHYRKPQAEAAWVEALTLFDRTLR